jgi:predicted glycogen debranching enzyme
LLVDRLKRLEWLEADGLGGFASGTAAGIRTRRYHALLLSATAPPTGRVVLVNGYEAWIQTRTGRFALSSHDYAPGVRYPDGAQRIVSFTHEPWPRWTFQLDDGVQIEHELFVARGTGVTALRWRLDRPAADIRLFVRPLMSGRDYHALHHENPAFRFEPDRVDGRLVVWRPYSGLPSVVMAANGAYTQAPAWYRNFLYEHERERGLDDTEDLASPGYFEWDVSAGEAVWMLSAGPDTAMPPATHDVAFETLRSAEEQRRRGFVSPLHRAADAYLVAAKKHDAAAFPDPTAPSTIIAGYPWFTDWGRDTFIAMRGLCLGIDRLDVARRILLRWAETISEGMVPNRFPDDGSEPEYNSVDASLWYVIAVHEYLGAARTARADHVEGDRVLLHDAVERILSGYAEGTRYGIRMDADALLAAGVPGIQLTWMDAKLGDRVITPRIGKPVEIQALWLNALHIGAQSSRRWKEAYERGRAVFADRFWNAARGCLYDVVDCDHRPGAVDGSFRPNQIFAVGGLPVPVITGDRARMIVDAVEAQLWTPMGLRSLASGEPGYVPLYEGGVAARDGAYHQGTVWPWLAGPFIEAWVRTRGSTPQAKQAARRRFIEPLLEHTHAAGLGHVSEIADAESPHMPRGCPFQAWSLGEVLRVSMVVLGEGMNALERRPGRTAAAESALPAAAMEQPGGRGT